MKIKRLKWDSDFFGFGIAKLLPGRIEKINEYAKNNKIRLVWCLANIKKSKNINLLEQNGFEFVDLKITFSIESHLKKTKAVHLARKEDIFDLKKIAHKAFVKDSRFNHKNIDKRRVDKFYESWVEKAVEGTFDDCCFVTKTKGGIAGFATYKRIGSANSSIGLIAVADGYRGLGIGSKLVSRCVDFAYEEGRNALTVSTEGKNIAAQNFYIKNGFAITKIESWYYKWTS